jgi:thiol-disulfide isomerase/thioredoxin
VQGAVGAALPSGAYVPRSGLTALQETANYLTLGRGVSWALLDVDAAVAFLRRWNMQLQTTVRLPLYQAFDGFGWGPEVRVAMGPSVSWWERLTVSALAEVQWRAQSTELDPFSAAAQRIASINTGGLWFTLTPTVQVRIGKYLSVLASLRIPLGQRVEGLQFVPALGGFVGMALVLPLETKQTSNDAIAGKVTVIEYGASWCEPCKRLTPLLMEYQASHRDVVVRQIDATTWSAEELAQNVPGAVGLPVVVIISPEGKTLHTLVGERAFDFAAAIETQSVTTQ